MGSLQKALYKLGKFNITYVIGRNLSPWERQCCVCYLDVVYAISTGYQKTPARGETKQSLYYIYPFTIFGNF